MGGWREGVCALDKHHILREVAESREDVWFEEEEKKISENRHKGVVKFFAPKGFGFITAEKALKWPEKLDAGSDIYVSREELEMAEESKVSLWKGMEVEF